MIKIAVISLLIFIALGVPVSIGIGLSGLLAVIFGSNLPILMVAQQMVRGVNTFPLMAMPLFVLAGEIMSEAKLSEMMIRFAKSLVRWMTGGLGMVCVVANMIFAGVTGSGAAAISAVGGLTAPELEKNGYEKSFTASLIAGSGALGPIIPPSTNMIVIGSITGVSVGRMFMGGILPGVLIGIGLMILCFFYARSHHVDEANGHLVLKEVGQTFIKALPALIMPLIILGGVAGGVFTATEAGIVACDYGLLCGLLIYRTIKIKDLFRIFRRACESSAMLLMIMATASIYSYIFAREGVATVLGNFILSVSHNPYVVVAIITGIMLIVGCFMETLSATVVLMPIFWPIVTSLGVDPIQFCVLFTIATVVGGLTPPVGSYLFLSMSITGASFRQAVKYCATVLSIIFIVMIAILFIPGVATAVPNLLMGRP